MSEAVNSSVMGIHLHLVIELGLLLRVVGKQFSLWGNFKCSCLLVFYLPAHLNFEQMSPDPYFAGRDVLQSGIFDISLVFFLATNKRRGKHVSLLVTLTA